MSKPSNSSDAAPVKRFCSSTFALMQRFVGLGLLGLTLVTVTAQTNQAATSSAVPADGATDRVDSAITNAPSRISTNAVVTAEDTSITTSTNALPSNVTTNDLVLPKLEARLLELKSAETMDPVLRAKLTELYQSIVEQLRAAVDARAREAQFRKARIEAPAEVEKIRESLMTVNVVLPGEADQALSVRELEGVVSQYETELAVARSHLSDLQREPPKRADRRLELSNQLSEARTKLEKLGVAGADTVQPAEMAGAQRLLRLAQRSALTAQIGAITQQLAFYDEAKDLLTAQTDRASSEVARLEAQIKAWRELTGRRRQQEAQVDISEATAARHSALVSSRNQELVVQLADRNDEIVALRVGDQGLTKQIERTSSQLTVLKSDLATSQESYRRIRNRIQTLENAGVRIDKTVAKLLRFELQRLGRYDSSLTLQKDVEAQIASTLSQLIEFQESRFRLNDIAGEAQELISDYSNRTREVVDADATAAIRKLLEARRDYLDALVSDLNTLLAQLLSMKTIGAELVKTRVAYAEFIRERILWIRSASPWSVQGFLDACNQLVRALPGAGWVYAGASLRDDIKENSLIYGAVTLVFLALLVSRRRLNTHYRRLCELGGDRQQTSFTVTLKAILVVGLMSNTWTLWLTFLGWRFSQFGAASFDEFTRSLGRSLFGIGLSVLIVVAFRIVCRKGGLGETHFGWLPENTRLARRNFLWLLVTLVPLRILEEVVLWNLEEVRHLEQTLFALAAVVVLVFAHRMLHPSRGLQLGDRAKQGSDTSLFSLRSLLYVVSVALPIGLAITALRGYYYSAWEIALHVGGTVRLFLVLALVRAVLYRWLTISRRRMAASVKKHREQEKLEALETGETVPPRKISLMEIIEQAQKLIRTAAILALLTGTYFIWRDFVPALGALDHVPVNFWSQTPRVLPLTAATVHTAPDASSTSGPAARVPPQEPTSSSQNELPGSSPQRDNPLAMIPGLQTSSGEVVDERGSDAAPNPSQGMFSVADLLAAIVALVVTVAAVRNIPGLLQVVVLNHLQLKPGVGYAITMVIRYAIVIVGVLVICVFLGISWSKVQWIAAAFSLGIAFGLQEIFANFISGLIILFERPIRIGDIVTVGEVSGTVTKINIRATTITDWDRKEYLVPNREFITSKLLNWTLTDPITRVLLPVGIAYGSDTDKARELLLEAAQECEHALKEPAPRAIFFEFGDNSLNFRLYVHIPRRDYYLDVMHTLTTSINRKFAAAGISIAFPQRDVHLDQIGPLKVEMLRGTTKPEADTEK